MLGGVGNIGTLSARRRVIAAAGGGGVVGVIGNSRSGTSDNNVHTLSSLNALFMIPDVHYISQTANDNTENYSVKDVLFTSGSSASHTFYLANKLQLNTSSYHNDLAVGAIQIHTASAVVFAGGAEDISGFTTSDDVSSNDPTIQTYSGVVVGASVGRWNKGSSTTSLTTGAADSIDPGFQNTSNALPNAGDEVIPQADSGTFGATNYIYTETSSSTTDHLIYLKFTFSLATNTAHRFIFAYNLGVPTGDTGDDKDDQIGLYIQN
jgi:hypothetical protein